MFILKHLKHKSLFPINPFFEPLNTDHMFSPEDRGQFSCKQLLSSNENNVMSVKL